MSRGVVRQTVTSVCVCVSARALIPAAGFDRPELELPPAFCNLALPLDSRKSEKKSCATLDSVAFNL